MARDKSKDLFTDEERKDYVESYELIPKYNSYLFRKGDSYRLRNIYGTRTYICVRTDLERNHNWDAITKGDKFNISDRRIFYCFTRVKI